MHLGKGEGAQIIQLFGRGVRLRGLDGSLKRSGAITGVRHPEHLRLLETLNVYGVQADYMAQFKEYLVEEGLPPNDNLEEVVLPVLKTLPARKLTIIRVKPGGDFLTDGAPVALGDPPESLQRRPISLDWYPKLGIIESDGVSGDALAATENEETFTARHLAFMNLDRLYYELVRYKRESGFHNLTIGRDRVRALLLDASWYALKIPPTEFGFDGAHPLRRARMWDEVALALLKKYVQRYYKGELERFQAPFREYAQITEDDPNFFDGYQFTTDARQTTILTHLRDLKQAIEDRRFKDFSFHSLDIFRFDRHLYYPLVHLSDKVDVKVKPVELNEGERNFVVDLRDYYQRNPTQFEDTELYLLRNMTRGKGIGFFEAGNFYPDFILWLLYPDTQYVTFIDPKGIRNLEGETDPKIDF